MSLPPVLNKRDMVQRLLNGEFGNAGPTWNSVEEFWDGSPKTGRFHLRCRIASGPTFYDLSEEEVQIHFRRCLSQGYKAEDWCVGQMAPTEKTVIQGEVQQTPQGLYFYHTFIKKPMRDALQEGGTEAYGVMAQGLLKTYLPAVDYDWLQVLLDRYPGHVIEFSAYSTCYGTLPGRKTAWWEVRLY